jgi:hypothetical protein
MHPSQAPVLDFAGLAGADCLAGPFETQPHISHFGGLPTNGRSALQFPHERLTTGWLRWMRRFCHSGVSVVVDMPQIQPQTSHRYGLPRNERLVWHFSQKRSTVLMGEAYHIENGVGFTF